MPFLARSTWSTAVTLTVLLAFAPAVMAIEPPAGAGRTKAIEEIVESWESVNARLTSLLDELPPAAHGGILRAIEANRLGRERALAALEGAGSADSTAARERAQQALADAVTRAERGFAEARAHVPADVLPRLEEASARMQEGVAKGAEAVGSAPVNSTSRAKAGNPSFERPSAAGRPGAAPSGVGRPAGARQPQPSRRPGG